MPNGAFNICCPRDGVSRHNGGPSGAPLKPLRVDSVLRTLSTLRGLRGAPEVPPLCRETQSLGQQIRFNKVRYISQTIEIIPGRRKQVVLDIFFIFIYWVLYPISS